MLVCSWYRYCASPIFCGDFFFYWIKVDYCYCNRNNIFKKNLKIYRYVIFLRRIIGSGFTEKCYTRNVRLSIKHMIYFGSGSSFEFSELWIQAKAPYPTHIILVPGIQYLEIIKTPYIQSNKYLSEMFYFILVPVQYTQSRIPRPKLRRTNKLYICSLIFS